MVRERCVYSAPITMRLAIHTKGHTVHANAREGYIFIGVAILQASCYVHNKLAHDLNTSGLKGKICREKQPLLNYCKCLYYNKFLVVATHGNPHNFQLQKETHEGKNMVMYE